MARSTASAPARTTKAWAESDVPTRPMPRFVLADASRLLQEAREHDQDQTVMMGAEENEQLLANARALGQGAARNTDDEPTLDTPVPLSHPDVMKAALALDLPVPLSATPIPMPAPPPAVAMPPVAVTLPPVALRAVAVVAFPVALNAVVPAAPVSCTRARITPQLAQAARDARAMEDLRRTSTMRPASRNVQTVVVVGIWAFALSLCGVLMFLAMSP